MKKLFLFLLLIPVLINAQTIEYFPKRDAAYRQIREHGWIAVKPEPFDPNKTYQLEIAIHGVGEWSGGTIKSLENLALGFDNDNNGTRESPAFVTPDMYKAVNQFNIILIVPTYEQNTFFEPSQINYLYDWAQSNYSLHPKMILTGFSYGGGAVWKYSTSSLTNANRVLYAVPVAGVSSIVDASIPGKANLPIHAFHCDKDPRVASSNTINQVTAINKTASLKAIYTFFRIDDHAGNVQAWSLTPPKAPGGQGFTDAAENIYQVAQDIRINGPRQMKSGTVVPDPIPEPVPIPSPVTLTADFNLSKGQVITTTDFLLDASTSIGVKTGWDAYRWDIRPTEAGSWNTRPEGGMYGGPTKKLIGLANGKYSIALTVRDDGGITLSKNVVIEVRLASTKIPVSFSSETDIITYSDGSTEKGTAVFSAGKWVVKNAAGTVIEL